MTTDTTDTRAATIEYLARELGALFPGHVGHVWVRERRIIGETNIHIRYTHNALAEQCRSGIIENDPAYMAFVLWNDERGGSGYYIEFPTTHMGRVFDGGAVRFRKLKGKTEREAAEKLVAWFARHRDHILRAGAEALSAKP